MVNFILRNIRRVKKIASPFSNGVQPQKLIKITNEFRHNNCIKRFFFSPIPSSRFTSAPAVIISCATDKLPNQRVENIKISNISKASLEISTLPLSTELQSVFHSLYIICSFLTLQCKNKK